MSETTSKTKENSEEKSSKPRRTSAFRSYKPITRTAHEIPLQKASRPSFTKRKVQLGSGLSFGLGTVVIVISLIVILVGPSFVQLANQYDQRNKAYAELDIARKRNAQLKEELQNWNDTNYIVEQARRRFGFVFPGETRYVVISKDGQAIGLKTDPKDNLPKRPWYLTVANSVLLAGEPRANVDGIDNAETGRGKAAPGKEVPLNKPKKHK